MAGAARWRGVRRSGGVELDRAEHLGARGARACRTDAASVLLDAAARVAAVGVLLALAGLWWGAMRLDAMSESALYAEVGESGRAEVVVTGPARPTPWAVRVPAEIRSSGESSCASGCS